MVKFGRHLQWTAQQLQADDGIIDVFVVDYIKLKTYCEYSTLPGERWVCHSSPDIATTRREHDCKMHISIDHIWITTQYHRDTLPLRRILCAYSVHIL